MQKIVIEIPDNKVNFFLELVKNLGFIKVHKLSASDNEFVEGTKKSLAQVEKHLKGEIELKTADQLLDEL